MKRKHHLPQIKAFAVMCFAVATFTGCTDKEDMYNTDDLKEKLEAFNFKTSTTTKLVINVGSKAAEEVLAIYPTEVDLITAKMHTDMLYSAFADANGTIETDIELPAAVKKVWIVSPTKPSLGVMTAEVQDGQLVLSSSRAGQNLTRAAGQTSTDDDGNITTEQEDGKTLTLFDIDQYVTVHEGTISAEDQQRGYTTLSSVPKSAMGHFYCIDRWIPTTAVVNGQYELTYHYGKTGNENGLKSVHQIIKDNAIEMAREQINWVNANSSSFKLLQANDINQVMNGETTVVNNADGSTTTNSYDGSELWITFISESAAYQNTFGYYIYKTDEEPTTVNAGNALERIVLFPSASVDKAINLTTLAVANGNPHSATKRQAMNNNSSMKTIYTEDAPLRAGDRIQLLFKDPETGAISKMFPKGYTVGFWFCADAYDPGWYRKSGSTTVYGIDMREEAAGGYKSKLVFTQAKSRYMPWRNSSGNTFFCNTNPKATNTSLFSGITTRYVRHEQKLYGEKLTVYSVEDGSDKKYNDILFALERKDYNSVTHSNSNVKLHQEEYHTISTYAFEDQWPDGYDFDMNDVIVEHEQSQTFTKNNYVYSVTDKFRLVSKLEDASNHNAFYVQFPEGEEGDINNLKVTIDGQEVQGRWEAETNSVIVFTDQREAIITGKTEVMVTRDLSNKNFKVAELKYRPYLVAQAVNDDGTTNIGQGRTEIHIPGDPITSLGKKLALSGNIDINYYATQFVSGDNEYPFALSLTNVANWVAPEPGVRIDITFPKYKDWRKANGYNYQDWFYNKQGYDYRFANGYYDLNATK